MPGRVWASVWRPARGWTRSAPRSSWRSTASVTAWRRWRQRSRGPPRVTGRVRTPTIESRREREGHAAGLEPRMHDALTDLYAYVLLLEAEWYRLGGRPGAAGPPA